jgi:hypothetical protein
MSGRPVLVRKSRFTRRIAVIRRLSVNSNAAVSEILTLPKFRIATLARPMKTALQSLAVLAAVGIGLKPV